MEDMVEFLNGMPWYFWIAVVAIAGSTVVQIVRLSHRHEERMALIKQGRDPDAVRDTDRAVHDRD